MVLSLSVLIGVEIVTSTSLVIKMDLVRVTESPAIMEEDMSTELLVTEIKLHSGAQKTCVTYRLENRCPHKLFD